MKQNKIQSHGEYSYMATLLVITAIAWWFGGFYTLFNDIVSFVQHGSTQNFLGGFYALFNDIASFVQHGSIQNFSYKSTSFVMILPVLLAIMVMDVLIIHIVHPIIQQILKKRYGTHSKDESIRYMRQGYHFFDSLIGVIQEELFARVVFLGLLTQLPIFSGTLGYWAMFLIGNSWWAYDHLPNYRDPRDRHLLRVLPQFIGGIFLSYVFIQYGFWATVLVHFGSNTIVYTRWTFQQITNNSVTIMVYSVSCALISYLLLGQDISDTWVWFESSPLFVLKGWTPWDYVQVSMFYISIFLMACDLLLYDHRWQSMGSTEIIANIVDDIADDSTEMIIYLGILYFSGIFIKLLNIDYPIIMVIASIVATCVHTGASDSAVARSFWTGIPIGYIILCIIQVFNNPWQLIGWTAVLVAVMIPRFFLCKTNT